jgi:hypothetical protein
MIRATISGWREGRNKVQLNHLLRQHAGYGLAEAKCAVDELLAGESLTFESADPESAIAFCRSASAIGAVCNTAAEAHETKSRAGEAIGKTATEA